VRSDVYPKASHKNRAQLNSNVWRTCPLLISIKWELDRLARVLCGCLLRGVNVAFSLLGYFVSMIMVLTAAVGVMIGLFNFSTSERVSHTPHPRPAIERTVGATNSEPRLFMSVPDTKDASPAKSVEATSAASKCRAVGSARNHNAGRWRSEPTPSTSLRLTAQQQ
jgi:hypothetical protein